ncbi:transposable element Tcb2 transposase [Trichonephila clavipes]|nr:transposable element Tcb2 transposase [Trichonephila clavipes]
MANCILEKAKIGLQDLIPKPHSSHSASFKDLAREPVTRYLPSNILEIDNYISGGLMVWECITLHGRTHRHALTRCTVTTVRYRHEFLKAYLRLFKDIAGPDFILMNHNTRHTELFWSVNFWNLRIFTKIDWSLRFADHIRIVHAWDVLGKAIASPKPTPRTIQSIKTKLQNEWD